MILVVANGYENDRLRFAFEMGSLKTKFNIQQSTAGESDVLGGDWYGMDETALSDVGRIAEDCGVTLLRDLEG